MQKIFLDKLKLESFFNSSVTKKYFYLCKMILRIGLVCAFAMYLVGCSLHTIYNGKRPYFAGEFLLGELPKHTLDYFLSGIADELINTNQQLIQGTKLVLVSFVDLEHLDKTNWLGNTMEEGMIYQMQRRGFPVVDYKSTGVVRVKPEGDFVLSRNWQELSPNMPVNYILLGTMLRQGGGVLVNARIINVNSRVVVASAQGFLPADHIGRDLDSLNKVRIENGSVLRGENRYHPENTIVIKPD